MLVAQSNNARDGLKGMPSYASYAIDLSLLLPVTLRWPPTGPARPAFACSASYGGYESADLASPAEAVTENRLGPREGFAKAGAQSAKAEVAGPMTSSAALEGRRPGRYRPFILRGSLRSHLRMTD
jgi:hypothetical protein